jgi:Cof subfamily protein (haloacid dehalogenase superfamily)
MSPSPYRLVVCDLDGTLVHHNLSVSPAVRQVIAEILTLPDIRFVLATGRMHPSAVLYANELGIREPVISYQGAMARSLNPAEPPLFHQPIPLAAGQGITRICKANGLHVNVYVEDVLSSNPHPVYVDEYRATSRMPIAVVPDVCDIVATQPSTKMVIIENDSALLGQARELVLEHYGDQVDVCLSRPNFLEVTAKGVNKWSAVSALATTWGIPAEAVLCIGDQENDLSMIEAAGWGVAMGNAPLSVQRLANEVVPSIDEDGAAVAMARRVLGRELCPVT